MIRRTIELRDWITLRGVSPAFATLAQEVDETLDTEGASYGHAELQTLRCASCTVFLEGSDSGQTFEPVLSATGGAGLTTARLNKEVPAGQAGRLYRYLRWRIAATDSWTATFRISVTLAD